MVEKLVPLMYLLLGSYLLLSLLAIFQQKVVPWQIAGVLLGFGLVMNVSWLDGQVAMTLEFDESREITITIQQQKPAEKSAAASDAVSLDGLKANYR